MFSTLFRKEMHQNLLTFRFAICTVVTLILVTLGIFIASEDYNSRLQLYHTRAQQHENALRRVHVYSSLQPTVLRPPEPLSILCQGYDAKLGTEVNINIYQVPFQATGERRGNEYMSVFRDLDLTVIVKVVLGLLALLLTFDALVGEKEEGTLKLILSHSLSRATLLLGKYLGGLAVLFLPLFMSLVIGSLILLFHAHVKLTPSDWLRIGGIFVSYFIYLSLMLLVGILVSIVTHRTSVSLVLCIFVWLLAVFIIPNSATAFASDVMAVEASEQAIDDRIAQLVKERDRLIRQQRDPFLDRVSGYFPLYNWSGDNNAILLRYGDPQYYNIATKYYSHQAELGISYAEKIFHVRQEYEWPLHRAARVEAGISYLSPAYILERLAESFAGTSIDDYDRFLAHCRTYRNQFITYLQSKDAFSSWRWFTDDPPNARPWVSFFGLKPEDVTSERVIQQVWARIDPAMMERWQKIIAQDNEDPARILDLSDMPRFSYGSPDVRDIITRSAIDLGLMLAMNVVLFAVSFVLFLRYDVR
ncbi:MAG: DUF3526 domain-containing protein [Acidobacteria bacterium]|nr:MAG: DUF3526 domain-containing protein [Acidobacteriota bacterium]